MSNAPTQQEIAAYLKWLEKPEGDANLQMALPLSSDIQAEATSDHPDSILHNLEPGSAGPQGNGRLSESEGKSRIRCLAIAGMSIPEISRRTGCHPEFVKTVVEKPGRITRRYE